MKLKHSAITALALMTAARVFAQQAGSIEPDGTVNGPAFKLPPSIHASDEAKKTMPRRPTDREAPMIAALAAGKAGEIRARIGEYMGPKIDKPNAQFGVATRTELLKTHKPRDIAVFGCSAGGLLTAESKAWFPQAKAVAARRRRHILRHGRCTLGRGQPRLRPPGPGLAKRRSRTPVLPPRRRIEPTRLADPHAGRAAQVPAHAGHHCHPRARIEQRCQHAPRTGQGRGVEADLHEWYGLGNAFFYAAGLPGSREAFDVMARFFRKHPKLAQQAYPIGVIPPLRPLPLSASAARQRSLRQAPVRSRRRSRHRPSTPLRRDAGPAIRPGARRRCGR